MDFVDQLNRFLNPVKTRIRNMVTRGVIKLVNDAKKVQQIQTSLLAGEIKDGVERYQEYGFTSVPLPGMEALVVFCNGDRSNGVVVAIGDRQFRLKELEPGEVALYTDEGDYIKLGRERKISVKTLHLSVDATEDVTFNTKAFNVNATAGVTLTTPTVAASGQVSDAKGTMQGMRDIYNIHDHTGNLGAPTSAPGSQM